MDEDRYQDALEEVRYARHAGYNDAENGREPDPWELDGVLQRVYWEGYEQF